MRRSALVQEIRPVLCRSPAPPATATGRQVAHGRSVHPDPGRAALSLARRGSGWRCARHPRSGTPRCQSRQAFLQAPAERSAIRAASDRDRQAAKLRRGQAPPAPRGRAPTKPISQQSCRELTSTDTAPRTPDATVQVAGPGANTSSPLTRSSMATSIHVGISWQLTHIVRSETRAINLPIIIATMDGIC